MEEVNDVRQLAWNCIKNGKKCGYDEVWQQRYDKEVQKLTEKQFEVFSNYCHAYYDHITGLLSKEEAQKKLKI